MVKKTFLERLKDGNFAEYRIGEFLERCGWNVNYDMDYAYYDPTDEYCGPRISFLPRNTSYCNSEMAEISWETVIAPDIFATKGKES